MSNYQLTLTHFLERAASTFPKNEIVSRRLDKSLSRMTYADFAKRSAKLAHALGKLGVKPGDKVATLCWNHNQHLEAYFAVPAIGAVVHTLNLRLHPNELRYIARHAEDKIIIADQCLLPLLEKFVAEVPSVEKVIVVADSGHASAPIKNPGSARESGRPAGNAAAGVEPSLRGENSAVAANYLDYETVIAGEREEYAWPSLDENMPAMICYTSGTTGNPKGVVYTHRSTVLHTLVSTMRDTIGVGEEDNVLPVVPMFHAAAWGLPYSAVATGAKVVNPGPHLDPQSLLDLMAGEKVTIAAGVPTIWLGILALLDKEPGRWDLSSVRSMVIGGSAAPQAMIEGFAQRHDLQVTHAWGMTETNPLGTLARVKRSVQKDNPWAVRASQGYAVTFVDTRHVDDAGNVLPRDGRTMGELEVRGPWVVNSYLGGEGRDRFTSDGWFKTGDVVTIDPDGYLRITDRSKDVIKSGGEWISSVAIENALMSHPSVLEAAVFAGQSEKWGERPLAAIVLKEGKNATHEELARHLEPHFAKFWLPDDYVFVPQIPRTSTGKFLKSKLREEYGKRLVGG